MYASSALGAGCLNGATSSQIEAFSQRRRWNTTHHSAGNNHRAPALARSTAAFDQLASNRTSSSTFSTKSISQKHSTEVIITPRATADARTATPASSPSAASEDPMKSLSQDVRNCTAVLYTKDGASVYVLGVSHVSKASCQHIRELIAAISPDAVLVELCRDRTGLLFDESNPPTMWHTQTVKLSGYDTALASSTATSLSENDLLAGLHLRCVAGAPITVADIEDDVVTLLSTGLFGSVRPITTPPKGQDAPSFFVDAKTGRLDTAAPLGSVQFAVKKRTNVPPVKELSVVSSKDGGAPTVDESIVAKVSAAATAAAANGGATVDVLMQARSELLTSLKQSEGSNNNNNVSVVFTGVESGRVTATVVLNSSVLTGLEGSAVGGKGVGIAPFQRQSKRQTASASPEKAVGLTFLMEGMEVSGDGKKTTPVSSSSSAVNSNNNNNTIVVTPWADNEVSASSSSTNSSKEQQHDDGIADSFATALTQQYAKSQAAAGRAVGISPGAAWRVSVEAAAKCGAQEVLLGDMPASITKRSLSQSIWSKSALPLFGGIAAALAGALIAVEALPSSAEAVPAAAVAVVVPLAAAIWPIAAPLLEVGAFAKMTAAQIEEAVRVKEPLSGNLDQPYFLWGEDSLLAWPAADGPILKDRDEFMVRALAAAVTGAAAGATPALVRTKQGGAGTSIVYKYAMPKGGSPEICPLGAGEGTYDRSGKAARRVVAVVGTAHVRGMAKAWGRAISSVGGSEASR